jgi:Ca-activated chloride channel family protein
MDLSALQRFHFLYPAWLWMLVPLLAIAVGFALRRARSGAWAQVVEPELLGSLRLDGGGRGGDSPWPWLGLAWVLAVVALAGPSWQQEASAAFRAPDDWLVVLDLSPSMAVSDLAPDRAARARFVIDDLLAAARDARVGLIAFAGEAHTVVPLTSDVATVRALVQPLAPGLMPEGGDALAPALAQAGQLLQQSASRHAKLIVLTDGFEDPARALEAAVKLHQQGAQIEVVGVGTPGGAPLIDAKGLFVHDDRGQSVMSRLPTDELQRIAAAGGGRYWSLAQVHDLIASLPSRESPLGAPGVETGLNVAKWRNDGAWLLPLLLLLVPQLARRGWL